MNGNALLLVSLLLCSEAALRAQQWRDLLPPGTPIEACADATHGGVLLVGYTTAAPPVYVPSTWWFDGTGFVSQTVPGQPMPMAAGPMAHDALRGVTVLFVPGAPGETWEHDGAGWTKRTTATTPPVPGGRMVFAEHLGVTVLVGSDGEVWHFDGSDWSAQFAAVQPPPRAGFALGYDPQRQRVVMFGGATPAQTFDDTWEYDGVAWQQVTTQARPPAGRANACFDRVRGDIVARVESAPHDWAYDGAGWQVLATSYASHAAPAGRLLTSPFDGRALWLAVDESHLFEQLLPGTWLPVAASERTDARYGAGVAVDARRDLLMVFGGGTLALGTETDTHWIRAGDAWFLHEQLPRPPARLFPGFAHDPAADRFVLFGGAASSGVRGDTWTFAAGSWQFWQQAAAGPSARERMSMLYDPLRRRIVMFGGRSGSGPSAVPLGDLWAFEASGWVPLPMTGGPTPRFGATVAYDAANDRIVLFGGDTGSGRVDETWFLRDTKWTRLAPGPAPSARSGAAMAYDPFEGDVVLVGGRDGAVTMADSWELRGTSWQPSAVPPPVRQRYAGNLVAVPGRQRLELLRGGSYSQVFGAVWTLGDHVVREAGAAPRVAVHGTGCVGSVGAPRLAARSGSTPALGSTFTIELDTVPPGAPVLFALGHGITTHLGETLPVELAVAGLPGCWLWISPDVVVAKAAPAGIASHAIQLPPNAALSGAVLAAQGVAIDLGTPNGLAAVSNALVATVR